MSPLRTRVLEPRDLAWTVGLHLEALPHGFFAQLGPRFVAAYHQTFVESPYALALAAEEDGRPVGFVVGVADPALHRSWLTRRRRLRLAALGGAGLLRHPTQLARFVATRVDRYARGLARRSPPERGRAPAAVLTHLAIFRDRRRGGAGRRLAEQFVAEARRRGVARVQLTTLEDDRGAASFWRALGWEDRELVTDREGQRHFLLEREL